MQRPTGVTILAILALIGGIFAIIGGISLIGLGGLAMGPVAQQAGADTADVRVAGGLGMALGGGTLLLGIVDLVLGWGFWKLKPWAWLLGVILQAINILWTVVGWIGGFNIMSLVSIIIAGVILWYLFQPHVKKAFGRA